MGFSPLIEKALLNNYATLRNYSVGGSGCCKIDIPDNHFGIITDFEYFPWVYLANLPATDIETQIEAFTFQEICFYVNNKPYKYTFKVNFGLYDMGVGALAGHYYLPLQSHKVSTFIYCDSSPYIIFKNPQMLNGIGLVSDFGTLQKTQNPAQPDGFGSTENTVRSIDDQSGIRYIFPNISEAGGNTGVSYFNTINSGSNFDLYPNTIGGAPNSNIQLPLCNVHMVMVAEQNRNLLNIRD